MSHGISFQNLWAIKTEQINTGKQTAYISTDVNKYGLMRIINY